MTVRSTLSNEPRTERAALVTLASRASRASASDPDTMLDELAGLAEAAGASVVYRTVQTRVSPDATTYVGRGKAEALLGACEAHDVTVVIVDSELTPAQTRHLEEILGRRVIDRTALILDIFARRARTREGQLQVELAQLEYRLPRLAGSSEALSRLGGGIGTRGPGETKLETDRRRIRDRIAALKRDIAQVERRRGYLRARRHRVDEATVALVGYTNAGKSTLFNALTGADVTASDALFVTLDPVVRKVRLPDAGQLLVSDTVGFIDRLPHQLVAAFRATLEEVAGADLLVHVIDASAPDRDRRIAAVRAVLLEIDAEQVPVLDVFNKIDRLTGAEVAALAARYPDAVLLSAMTGDGRDRLIRALALRLALDAERVTLVLDGRKDTDRRVIAELYRHARVVSHITRGHKVTLAADVPRKLAARLAGGQVPAR